MSDYAAGTVATATVRGVPGVRVFRSRNSTRVDQWFSSDPVQGDFWHEDRVVADVRPLVVLDLDDMPLASMAPTWLRAQAADIDRSSAGGSSSVGKQMRWLADQIEAQTRPPKPEVYRHLILQQRGVTVESICGKAWIPHPDVTVVGKCPECLSVAEGGWVA